MSAVFASHMCIHEPLRSTHPEPGLGSCTCTMCYLCYCAKSAIEKVPKPL